jgi:mannose-6-phosphate isomerase-like protein (cupin superfamily)
VHCSTTSLHGTGIESRSTDVIRAERKSGESIQAACPDTETLMSIGDTHRIGHRNSNWTFVAVMKHHAVYRTSHILIAVLLAALAGLTAAWAADSNRHVRNRFFVKHDREVRNVETPPHSGIGKSTAYRYFDEVKDARVIFRKRALHKGASIGMHVLSHDEIYYVISGSGLLAVDDTRREVGPDTAIFMHEGADVGIQQVGDEDLVIIISYPPAAATVE